MQQVYHSNAVTNINIRQQIQNSNSSIIDNSLRFGVSTQTVHKWKNRDFTDDASSRPKNIEYALTELEKALIVNIRRLSWVSLDEIWETLLEVNNAISRSSVYRCLVSSQINKIPKEEREKAKKFKEYEPGYLHIDVTYLPKFNGKSYYLFVAIDRCTRAMFYWIYENKTAENTEDFMAKCFNFFPTIITHVLTDNGLEFTNRLLKSKTGDMCVKPSKLDVICEDKNIQHRCTAPFTPQTNGMVERANGTIKTNTILKNKYLNVEEMNNDLLKFLGFYNLYRRHGSLRRELEVKTPISAIEKWYELKPEIFIITPQGFKNNLLNLQTIIN